MTPCAGNNTVAALLAGAIDAAAAHRLELHLDACTACRQLVSDLGRGLSALSDGLPRIGDRVGRYEIRRVLGVGGMGVVYEGHDTTLDRRVAIKLLRPDVVEDAGGQLLVEAQAMARLHHPNIATVHDVGVVHGQLYLCMELVTGATLREWTAGTPRSWRELVAVFLAAGRGLAYVHRMGLVHLDFKPDNVLVCRSGRVVVTDFGLARMIGGRRQRPRVVVGTPAYMAPEQRRGEASDARTDQFGFCAALREALGVCLGARHAPRWLRRALARGLAHRPADRFASMEALLAVLERGEQRPRRRLIAGLATATAITLAVLAARSPATVTQLVDRLVVHTIVAPGRPGSPGRPEDVAVAPSVAAPTLTISPTAPNVPTASTASTASLRSGTYPPDEGFATRVVRAAPPRSGPTHPFEPLLDESRSERPGFPELPAAPLAGVTGCDDGSPLVCAIAEPTCPTATVLAVQDGCWTCAEAVRCAPLGIPRTCNDGSPLRCTTEQPACAARQVAAVRNGCWRCEDAFTCAQRSFAGGKSPPPPPVKECGNGRCETGEDRSSCPADCATGGGSNGGGSNASFSCGNGFCENGEDHASCPADCCEQAAGSSGCVASCGNGFCETDEEHASCATDCCETTSTGACVPQCGNGFCEEGEDALHCPADC